MLESLEIKQNHEINVLNVKVNTLKYQVESQLEQK